MFSLLTFKSRVLGFAALGVIGIAAALPFALSEDGPWVAVSFEQGSYAVAEGNSVTVTVTLDVVPGREVVVPITATEQGGASDSDYSRRTHLFDLRQLGSGKRPLSSLPRKTRWTTMASR